MRMGDLQVRTRFGAVQTLAGNVLLGATYIKSAFKEYTQWNASTTTTAKTSSLFRTNLIHRQSFETSKCALMKIVLIQAAHLTQRIISTQRAYGVSKTCNSKNWRHYFWGKPVYSTKVHYWFECIFTRMHCTTWPKPQTKLDSGGKHRTF